MNKRHKEKNTHTSDHAHTLEGGYYYGSTPEPENKFLTIRLSQSDFTKLNDHAKRLGTTKSGLSRAIIKNMLP